MNSLGLALTALWMYLPVYRLANATDTNNLCAGAQICSSHVNSNGQTVVTPQSSTDLSNPLITNVKDIVDTLLYVAGAVAVIIIIVGGIRYITSTGDATRVKQSKETIMYAIAGLVIAILAYAVVNFVSNNV